MKKIILSVLFILSALFIIFPGTSNAQDLTAVCDGSGSCSLSSSQPLFSTSQNNLWYPGKSVSKTLKVINNHPTDTLTVTIKAQNPQLDSSSCQFDQQLNLSIIRTGSNPPHSLIWSGSLNNFYQQTPLSLAVFSPGSFDEFVFTVTLPASVGNQCQDKTTSFDLLLNFSGETITPTPSPTSTTTTTTTPSATHAVKKPGEIKGEKTASFCKTCLWWPILLGEFVVLLLYFFLILKKFANKIKKLLLISLIIPIGSYLIFLWLNKDCLTNLIFIKTPSFFCQYFWFLDLLVYISIIIFFKRKIKTS